MKRQKHSPPPTKADGMPRKLLDATRFDALGWRPRTDLATGIRRTWEYYLEARQPGR